MRYTYLMLLFFNLMLLIISLYSTKKNDKFKFTTLIGQALIISLFYGLRDKNIGIDTNNYVLMYLNQSNNINIGMRFINKILFTLINSHWSLYLFIINLMTSINMAISYWIIFKDEKKYVNLGFWSLFLMPYIILMQTNIIRQGLALSFLILGLLLVIQLNKKIGWMLIIVGCTVHYSMVYILILLLVFYKLKMNTYIIVSFSVVFLAMSITGINSYLISIIPSSYIQRKFFGFMSISYGTEFLLKYLFYFISYLYMSLFTKKIESQTYNILHKFMGALVLTSSILYESNVLSTRFIASADFIIPIIYLFPYKVFKEKRIYVFFFIVFITIYYIYIINSNSFKVVFLL